MRTTSIEELKKRLRAYLDGVRSGEEIIVTDRGHPVAKVVPLKAAAGMDDRTAHLVRMGHAVPPSRELPEDFWERPRPSDQSGRSLEILLEERAEGR
jgi:prevent-host-death family protein